MLITNQPLSTVTNTAYKEKMGQFDPSFVVPGEKKIKTMIVKSYQHNNQILKNILSETAAMMSLTTDLWSSRAKHGYIGVTAAWITPDFNVKDVMLEIKYAPSPHTADVVAELLYECISSWDLNGRVTAIITDNGSNMKAAFPILTQKNQCENIQTSLRSTYTPTSNRKRASTCRNFGSTCEKNNQFFFNAKTNRKIGGSAV